MNRRWPAAIAAAGAALYASDSLRHRREGGRGYDAATARRSRSAGRSSCGRPRRSPRRRSREGNDAELLVNGDAIFPAFLETIASAEHT